MKEIKGYETMDGKKFFKEEEALDYENGFEKRLRMNEVKDELMNKAKEIFRKELIEEKLKGDKESQFYFSEDGQIDWDGEEDLAELKDFVNFLIDITLSHGGKTFELMNYIVGKFPKVEK